MNEVNQKQNDETFEWWKDPWWEQPKYSAHVGRSLEEIVTAIAVLKKYFTAKWMEETFNNNRGNIVFRNLSTKGSSPLTFMTALGLMLHDMESCQGIQKKIQSLKGSDSHSAYFELTMANILVRNGFSIAFPKEGGKKTHDITVSKGKEIVAIECKRLEQEQWEAWANQLTFAITASKAWAKERSGLGLNIELDPRISEIRFNDDEWPEINESIMGAIVDKITEALESIENPIAGTKFNISGFGQGSFYETDGNETAYMTGAAISHVSQLRRIMNNGLLRACEQLPSDLPGIIAVKTNYLPNIDQAQLVFNAIMQSNPDRYRKIAAMLISPLRVLNDSRKNILLLHKNGHVDPYKLASIQAIIEATEPYIV